jgi:circadian clock protein KaiC
MALTTVKTDIEGFDALLGGGIPKGSTLLISGPPGSGKTVMALQYTFNQARKGERVLFVSTCELLYTINKFASPMSFFDLGLIRTGVNLDYYGPREEGGFVEFWDYSLGTIMEGQYAGDIFDIVQEKVSLHRIDHLIVDSITSINLFLGDDMERRKKLLLFMGWASRSGCTIIFTAEPGDGEGMERQLTDGIVDLGRRELPGAGSLGVSVKTMEVAKLRGQAHSSGRYLYNISSDGVHVLAPGAGAVPEGEPAKTGVEGLDENIVGMPYGSAWHFDVADATLYRPLMEAMIREALRSGDGLVYVSSDCLPIESLAGDLGPESELKGRLATIDPFAVTVEMEPAVKAARSRVASGKRCRFFVDAGALEMAVGPEEAWRAYAYVLSQVPGKDDLLVSFCGPASGCSLSGDIVASSDGAVDVWDYGGYALLQVKKAPYAKSFEPFVARLEKGKIRLKPL